MLRLPRPHRVRLAGAAIAVSAIALLAACTPGEPEPSASTSASPEPSAGPTESTPAETEAPEETSPPFAIECDVLLTPQQVYDFNPNFGADPGYEPSTPHAKGVVEDGGTACGWLNQTSGEVIEIAVATPSEGALANRANEAAAASTPVPTYGTPPEVEGYFSRSGERGEAQVFRGPYWIVISSTALFEPGDAQQLAQAVLGNLPAA
ncbi:iron ABC transporter ATP-binding protein [Agromyces sp. G08B096]|uniref:Iron ABC transporter ATP-binding protein n=1 Tax=Agromyces sp. G08B096 TaxID=3156399 RepID=A0AAU7W3W8_9MICO